MSVKCVKEAFGYVLKREQLASYKTDIKLNDLVLQSIDPYPGYYSGVGLKNIGEDLDPRDVYSPFDIKATSLFLLIKPSPNWIGDFVIRAIKKVKSQLDFEVDAQPAQLTFNNSLNDSIRIILEDRSKLPEVLEAFKQNGIAPLKNKDVKAYQSEIKVAKFFELEELEDGIFKELVLNNINYLQIPKEISLDDMSKLSEKIKNNHHYKMFDVALAAFYTKEGVTDYLRVYDIDATPEQLKVLQGRFIHYME